MLDKPKTVIDPQTIRVVSSGQYQRMHPEEKDSVTHIRYAGGYYAVEKGGHLERVTDSTLYRRVDEAYHGASR